MDTKLRDIEDRQLKKGYQTIYISPSNLIMAREYKPGTIQVTTWPLVGRCFTVFIPAGGLTRLAVLFGT